MAAITAAAMNMGVACGTAKRRRDFSSGQVSLDARPAVDMTMKLRMLVVLALTLMAVSACVSEPDGYYGGGSSYYRGGGEPERDHDYGRHVWRE